jgi:post-segregation antitoxin (ccd killing protein)
MDNKVERINAVVEIAPTARCVGVDAKRYKTTIRLTTEEHDALLQACKRAGVSISAFTRAAISSVAMAYLEQVPDNEVE